MRHWKILLGIVVVFAGLIAVISAVRSQGLTSFSYFCVEEDDAKKWVAALTGDTMMGDINALFMDPESSCYQTRQPIYGVVGELYATLEFLGEPSYIVIVHNPNPMGKPVQVYVLMDETAYEKFFLTDS